MLFGVRRPYPTWAVRHRRLQRKSAIVRGPMLRSDVASKEPSITVYGLCSLDAEIVNRCPSLRLLDNLDIVLFLKQQSQ